VKIGCIIGIVTVHCWKLLCSESGEIEDEITDLIQHIQRVHCLENKGCICYAANENRVCMYVLQLLYCRYGDGAGDTVEENSSIFSLI